MVREKEWFKAIRGGHVQYIVNLLNALKDKRPGKLKNFVKRLHTVDGTQSTALHISCQYDHSELVKILLQNGASPNLADESGCTALHIAAWNGSEKTCDQIMKNSQVPVEVNAVNTAGETPLHLASQHDHDKVVETLLSLGADPLIKNAAGITAMGLACQFGRTAVVKALVERVPKEVKCITEYDVLNHSPLHMASHYGHAQVVDVLVKKGFPINVKTKEGVSLLHEAVMWNRLPVVEVLLKHNIDKEAKNSEGKTALDLLAQNNQDFGVKMRNLIINHDPNRQEEEEEEDSIQDSSFSRASKKKKSVKKKKETQDEGEEEEEDKEMNAILGIGAVLSKSSDELRSTDSPRSEEPTTPERMRRLSSKYRAQFEKICSNDHEDEDLVAIEHDMDDDADVFE